MKYVGFLKAVEALQVWQGIGEVEVLGHDVVEVVGVRCGVDCREMGWVGVR